MRTKDIAQAVINRVAPVVNNDTVIHSRDNVEAELGLRLDITMLTTGAITGTVQWFLQDSCDGGQTWDDVIASNTFAFGAALTTQRFSVALSIAPVILPAGTPVTQGGAVSNLALAAGGVRTGPIGSKIRIVERITAIAGSPVGPQYRIGLTAK